MTPANTGPFYDASLGTRDRLPETIGESEAMIRFQERLSAVAKVDRPVLIVGERGTGKELAINRLHYLSPRWQGPLVALNCAALSPSVVESELFGHESGAFTGAGRRRAGRFEAAEGGTLFLDEIGLIPIEVQEKILRAVEYRQFERVGGSHPVEVDVRIVGATNADLPRLAAEGRFKRDLLDRLSFEVLFLPPLRERIGDIALLARHFATRMAMELGRDGFVAFSDGAIAKLNDYHWPGNIRELKNVVERAVYKSPDARIEAGEIVFDPFANGSESARSPAAEEAGPRAGSASAAPPVPAGPESFDGFNLDRAVERFETDALHRALEAAQFHQGEAATLLGLSYHRFRSLYRKYKDKLGRRKG